MTEPQKRLKVEDSRLDPPIYLDYLATTPICKEASDAMMNMLQHQSIPEGLWGNPGSEHHLFGSEAKLALERARAKVAAIINCSPAEICFESGSTESINHAVRGVLKMMASSSRDHVVLSEIEHPAVMSTVLDIAKNSHTLVKPDSNGVIRASDVAAACIKGKTALVTVMLVNNEIGSVMNWAEISRAIKAIDENILLHCDASQAVGKVDVDVKKMGMDMLTVAGHKLYAPKGIGALYIRSDIRLPSLITGAGHELGRRAGTENVLLSVALGEACEAAMKSCLARKDAIRDLRERLFQNILALYPNVKRNGSNIEEERLPGALSLSFPGIRGFDIAKVAGSRGLAFSAGAACHTGEVKPSQVLKSVGLSDEDAIGTIRLSIGRYTTEKVRFLVSLVHPKNTNISNQDIERAVNVIHEAISSLY